MAAVRRISAQVARHVRSGAPTLDDIASSAVRASSAGNADASVSTMAEVAASRVTSSYPSSLLSSSSSPSSSSLTANCCNGGHPGVIGGGLNLRWGSSCVGGSGSSSLSGVSATALGNRLMCSSSIAGQLGSVGGAHPPPIHSSSVGGITSPFAADAGEAFGLSSGFRGSSGSSGSAEHDPSDEASVLSFEESFAAAFENCGEGEEGGPSSSSINQPFGEVLGAFTGQQQQQLQQTGGGERLKFAFQAEREKVSVSDMNLSDLQKYMSALLGPGRFEEAIALFKEWTNTTDAHGQRHKPDLMAYNMLLLAYNRYGMNTDRLLQVLEEMRKTGVEPNLLTFNILLRAAFRVRDSNLAEMIIRKLEDPGSSVHPDGDSYNFVVTICAMDKRVPPALQYMQSMLRKGFVPSKTTYSEVLTACARTRRTRDAVAVMKELQTQMLEPLPVVLGELLTAGAERDDAECALMALHKLARRRLGIDQGGLLLVLNAAARSGQTDLAEGAWAYLRECLGQELPHPAAYLARIHAYATKGDFESAFRALQDLESAHCLFQANGRRTDLGHELLSPFTSLKPLVVACSRGLGVLDTAYYNLVAMHEAGEVIPVAAVNCIIAGCSNVRDMDRAFQTFEEIGKTFDMAPDLHTYNALIDACAKTKQIATATQMFQAIEADGLQFDQQSFQFLIDAYVIDGNAPMAVGVLESMVSAGFTPVRPTLVRALRRCQRTGYVEGAERVKSLFIEYGYRVATSGDRRRHSIWNAATGRDDVMGERGTDRGFVDRSPHEELL